MCIHFVKIPGKYGTFRWAMQPQAVCIGCRLAAPPRPHAGNNDKAAAGATPSTIAASHAAASDSRKSSKRAAKAATITGSK